MATGRATFSFALAAVLVGTVLFQLSEAAAELYVVGDDVGWTIPSSPDFYDKWAHGKNFTIGDVLQFTFATGRHDVAEVPEKDYEGCMATKQMVWLTTSPANIRLTTAGVNYFMCTIPGHCKAGQMIKINVRPQVLPNATSPTATPSPSSAPSMTASAAGLFAAVLVSVAAFFY